MSVSALRTSLEWKATRERARKDIDYLASLVLEPKYLPLPPHVRQFAQIIRTNQRERVPTLLLASVGSLKSTTIGLLMLQDLLGDDPHILFGSKAGAVITVTGNFLRSGLVTLFGKEQILEQVKSVRGFLDQTQMFCVPGWHPGTKFPSFFGATLGTGIEGMRGGGEPAVAYLDDPVDKESQTSRVYRENARRWHTGTFTKRLSKDTVISCIGSPWHPDDYYTDLVKDGYDVHCFPIKRYPCPRLYSLFPNVKWHGEEYDLLWPAEWTGTDWVRQERLDGGSIPFRQRRLVDPEAIRGSRFKPEWFVWFHALPIHVRARLQIYMGIDPATGKTDIGDLTAIVIIGYDPDDNVVYVLKCAAGYWDPVATRHKIVELSEYWHPDRILIEDNAYQVALINQLTVDTNLPVFGQHAERDKVARIDTLAVPIETKRLQFCADDPGQQELQTELLDFPNTDDDDRADALEIACREVFQVCGQRTDWTTTATIVDQAAMADLHISHPGRAE